MEHLYSGKVRDLYSFGHELLLVASDRVSVYDVVLPTPIPDKGAVLTELSAWWFGRLGHIVPNHLISTAGLPREFARRALRCSPLRMIPVECIARGYLAGLGLREYEKNGTVSGVSLPPGLVEGDRLPEPIFTPTTKYSDTGHDEFITFADVAEQTGRDTAERLRSRTLDLYTEAASHAADKGLIIADTKFEFGWDDEGVLTLGDEACTPDSSRFWLAERWQPGQPQDGFDKQVVRDWAADSGWDKTPPGPPIPQDVADEASRRYIEIYERLTEAPWNGSGER